MTELALVRKWAAGDPEAGRVLTSRHYPSIYLFFKAKVESESVEDLVQSTFLTFCQKAKSESITTGVRPYLFGIARMKLLEHYRRKTRAAARFEPLEHSVADGNLDRSITSTLGAKDDLSRFYFILRTLPLDTQILVELKYYDQFTETELAAMFNDTPTAIRARVGRARRKLRDELLARTTKDKHEVTDGELEQYFDSLRRRVGTAPHR